MHFCWSTFVVEDGEVWIDGAQTEDELVADERFVRVHGAYGLDELETNTETHFYLYFWFCISFTANKRIGITSYLTGFDVLAHKGLVVHGELGRVVIHVSYFDKHRDSGLQGST